VLFCPLGEMVTTEKFKNETDINWNGITETQIGTDDYLIVNLDN